MTDGFSLWLTQLKATPETAFDELVRGRVALGRWSRASLGEILSATKHEAPDELDDAVSLWLADRIGQPAPASIDEDVWPVYLQDVFRAIAGQGLPQTEKFLRDRLYDLQVWLGPLRRSEALDPLAACLNALVSARTNQNLNRRWRKLVVGREPLPAYYREIGLLGLRRSRDDEGKLPPKAPFAFLAALVDLADTPGTPTAPALTERDWTRLTRAMLAGYRLSSEVWATAFEPVLATRPKSKNGRAWLTKLIPELQNAPKGKKPAGPVQLPTKSKQETDALIGQVRHLGPAAAGSRLEFVVDGYRKYAIATNDPYNLVRTFNRLAEAAKEHDADWAIARAEEALAWDRGNARNWTVVARCLWSRAERLHHQKKYSEAEIAANEAFDVLWESRFRFAYDAVVRTELAKFHRNAGDLEAAAAIYREASDDFPENGFCRTGLAEVLTEQDRLSDAEDVYRKAIRELPPAPACLCGLAKVLRLIGGDKVEESRQLFRDAIRDFPEDLYAYTGLAEELFNDSAASRDEELREEARELFQKAADLHNNYATSVVRTFDQRWKQRVAQKDGGESHVGKPKPKSPINRATPDTAQLGPAERLGRALLAQWNGRRSQGTERDQHFAEAERLLSLDDSRTGECHAAFIEARGLLLVAREEFSQARDYFERQLELVAPSRPLGLRLGLLDARQRLGEPLEDDDETLLEELGPDASLLLTVLKVVQLLQTQGDEELLRRLLLEIYPRVRELAVKLPDDEELNEHQAASPDRMLANLLQKQFFGMVDIESEDDLADTSKVAQLRIAFRLHGRELSSSLEKLILSLAA
ncbi:MAG: tetratricopeptide (TPR) repeat protein [Planctomycetaceae bacterium]|jgi:tetratricopeptide (TPR) repeat protein